jgi:hypothetical protein
MVAVALTLSACGYNTIPTLEEQAKARWSDVQNQYQRRADLIPNLVATVQGYAAQEKSVLTSVIEARAKATQVKVDASDLTDPAKLRLFKTRKTNLPVRSADYWQSARSIPTLNRMQISWRCNLSSKIPRTASRKRAATISMRCAPITYRYAHSRPSFGPRHFSSATSRWLNSRQAKAPKSRRKSSSKVV